MTDVADAYSPVKSTSPTTNNTRPSSPAEQTTQSTVQERPGEQNVFTIAKLLDTSRPTTQNLSLGETSTLMAMREKIDERLRHSEATPDPRIHMPPAFVNQLQLWNLLQMMNPGGINFGSAPKTEQNDAEKSMLTNFNFQQQQMQLQEHQRNLLHPLVGVSGNSSNNSDLSRVSRESSRSPVGSNGSDGEHNGEGEFGLNPDGGIRKKKTRTVFSRSQVSQLEAAFNAHRYLNSAQRSQLSLTLGLTETQTKIWFQNRRNKWKRLANGEELNTSIVRPTSNGPLSTNQPTSNTFGSLAGNDAFRMFLQSQSSQFNPAHFIGQTGLTLPQLPIFGLTSTTRSDLSSAENSESPIVGNAPNGFEFARLFASNFLNNPAVKQESGNKKTHLVNKSERNSTNGIPNRLNDQTE